MCNLIVHINYICRHFNEIASGRVFHPTSPSPYSPSPTRRSLSPSPALFCSSGSVFPPSPPLRGRTHSFGAYPPHIHTAANRHLHMSSVSASSLSGTNPGTSVRVSKSKRSLPVFSLGFSIHVMGKKKKKKSAFIVVCMLWGYVWA